MKQTLILLAFIVLITSVFAQVPQKLSYQAVIRDADNKLVANKQIGMRITILSGSINGTEVYKEIYNPNPQSNTNGLVTLEIGTGISLLGNFANINWANGIYFIKTETDPTGGTNYTITGTSQLLSVPYALHAKTVETGNWGDQTVVSDASLSGEGTTAQPLKIADRAISGEQLAQMNATEGQVFKWDSTKWVPNEDIGIELPYKGNFNVNKTIFEVNNSIPNIDLPSIKGTGGVGIYGITEISEGIGIKGFSTHPDGCSGSFHGGNFEVRSNVQIGYWGTRFKEIKEIKGTTSKSSYFTTVPLPGGYTPANTRVLTLEFNTGIDIWYGGTSYKVATGEVSYTLKGTDIIIYMETNSTYQDKPFRILLMRVE